MKPWLKGLLVATLHVMIVLSLGAKLLYDRGTLPRVWARTSPIDPDSPLRGRYVSLQLEVDGQHLQHRHVPAAPKSAAVWQQWQGMQSVKLVVENSRLTALPEELPSTNYVAVRETDQGFQYRLHQPVDFYIPEGVPDPSRRGAGEELWVEVTVPPKGPPRPIRLGVMKEGKLTPLELR